MKKILLFTAMAAVMFLSGCMSVAKMQKEADGGDEIAQVLLALKFFYGSRDVRFIQYDEAFKYFNMAAKKENPLACYYLGEIYESGLGQTDVDYVLASEYYKRAAADMHELPSVLRKQAYLAMAKMYEHGRGVKKSDTKAGHFYKKACDKEITGSAPLYVLFLRRTRGELAADDLEEVLEDALLLNEPAANYLYADAIYKSNSKKALELYRMAANANHPEAMLLLANLSKNKMLVRSANEKAASFGYGPAFYELALAETKEEKRYELLKKSADRGYLKAVEALGDYYERCKEWSTAAICHYMADKARNIEFASPAFVRLESTVGLGLAVESIWQNKPLPCLAKVPSNVEYFIRGQKAGIAAIRKNYQNYLESDPECSYVNMDYVRLHHDGVPMVFAGDIFKTYYNSRHGAVGNDFYLNYAICAGYAGQGSIQFFAVERINLNRTHSMKWHLAKMLLKANAMALMGDNNGAYGFLVANYRAKLSENDRNFIVDFVNGNCNMLLKDSKKLSAALNIPAERFVIYKEQKKEPFYDLENRKDSNLVAVPVEPEIEKK